MNQAGRLSAAASMARRSSKKFSSAVSGHGLNGPRPKTTRGNARQGLLLWHDPDVVGRDDHLALL
eukprot:782884-Prorocentrum_lima.AAC.1